MLNTYGGNLPLIQARASGRMLGVLIPKLMTTRFGLKEVQGKNKTDTVKFRRYLRGGAQTAPVQEGVTPGGNRVRFEDYSATLQEFLDYYEITDRMDMLHPDDVVNKYAELGAKDAAETVELVNIDLLNNGTNVFYSGTATARTGVTASLSRNDFRKVKRFFERNAVQPVYEMVQPSTKISTSGVLDSYVAMGSTDLDSDVRSMQGFKAYSEYGNPMDAYPEIGEVGACESFRIFLSPLFRPVDQAGGTVTDKLVGGVTPSSSGSADVYRVVCVGEGAYGCVSLDSTARAQIIITPVDTPSKSDPGRQRGSIAWKIFYAAVRLDERRLARIECAASVL